MVFIDHSNLFYSLPSSAKPVTVDHYKALIGRVIKPFDPASHKEGTPSRHTYAFIYAPDSPTSAIPGYLRKLLYGLWDGEVAGAVHRPAVLEFEGGNCRAKLGPPGWKQTCTSFRREPTEKMLDVSLATDMVRFACKGVYDVAILVAGDRDYLPAVSVVRRAEGKTVINAFLNRNPLSAACDDFEDISALFKPKS